MTKTIIYSRELSSPIAIYLLILFSWVLAASIFFVLVFFLSLSKDPLSYAAISVPIFTPIIITGANLILQPINYYLVLRSKKSIYQLEVLSAFYKSSNLAFVLQVIVIISGIITFLISFMFLLYVGPREGIPFVLGVLIPTIVSISLPFIRISDEITQISSDTL